MIVLAREKMCSVFQDAGESSHKIVLEVAVHYRTSVLAP